MLKNMEMKFVLLMIIEVHFQTFFFQTFNKLSKKDITAHPNVKYEKAFWNGSWRVIVKTIKKIKSEEEILVDYGPTYWDE